MHALSTLSTALIGGGIALLYALSLQNHHRSNHYELNGVQFSRDQAIVNANTNVMHVSDLSLSILVEILNLNVLNMELLIGILVGVCVPLICIAWLLRGLHQSVDRLSTDCKAMLNQDPDIWNYTKVPGCDHLLLTLMMSARRQALWLIAGALGCFSGIFIVWRVRHDWISYCNHCRICGDGIGLVFYWVVMEANTISPG